MNYIKVCNWQKYQHYSQRNPPWIKLHNQLLDNYNYGCLQDDSKLLLITLFMLASRTENNIPADLEWIKIKGGLRNEVNLEPLIKANFINYVATCKQDDSKMIATCNQVVCTEKSRVEKSRVEKKREEGMARSLIFQKPSIDEISTYCQERKNNVKPQMFFDYYESNGWVVGKNKMKNWKAAIRTWEQRNFEGGQNGQQGNRYGRSGLPELPEEARKSLREAEELSRQIRAKTEAQDVPHY